MSGEFQTRLHAALQNSRPNSSTLSAFALDIEHYMEQTQLFTRIRLKKTGEPESALLITCEVSDPATRKSKVLKALKQVWITAPLGYGGEYDAFDFKQERDTVQMDFVSVTSEGVGVTGRVTVTGFEE